LLILYFPATLVSSLHIPAFELHLSLAAISIFLISVFMSLPQMRLLRLTYQCKFSLFFFIYSAYLPFCDSDMDNFSSQFGACLFTSFVVPFSG
jgi:hypothetical protein